MHVPDMSVKTMHTWLVAFFKRQRVQRGLSHLLLASLFWKFNSFNKLKIWTYELRTPKYLGACPTYVNYMYFIAYLQWNVLNRLDNFQFSVLQCHPCWYWPTICTVAFAYFPAFLYCLSRELLEFWRMTDDHLYLHDGHSLQLHKNSPFY